MNSFGLYLYKQITNLIPETRCFGIKRFLLRKCGAEIGKNVRICSSAFILGAGQLSIGDNTWIGHNSTIIASSKIIIGSNCDLAPEVFIGNGTHLITPKSPRIADIEVSLDTTIGNGCWLGAKSIVLPGVSIADKCVIAAGAVVTKSITEPLTLFAGIPAVLKKRISKNA